MDFALHLTSSCPTATSASPAATTAGASSGPRFSPRVGTVTAASTALLTSSNALERMRRYDLYVRMHKTRCRYLLLLLLIPLFYFQCTFFGRYDHLMNAAGEGSYGGLAGAVGGAGLAATGASGPSKDGSLHFGLAASDAEAAGDDSALTGSSIGGRRSHVRRLIITQALNAIGTAMGRMDLWEAQWWPPVKLDTRHDRHVLRARAARFYSQRGLSVASPQ
ncbi:hypothetical_protein (plasmid) [Leishmania braziliensis MHOM/BR/75/M2904]|uniref:Hypothetical_protein n=1 Tax=Leishmania braziliensis MHOM/BR/75/M2904 TaxID=420245 RepID=A0A3P3YY38_LEIBR|nr:unnamed protein product [Leishmania braziliensis]CAJ2467028.1 unnamed protein product [Leishmania braziliensis]SYZ62790.1 hypothetical_protein [Leishmania braziliensis MHOM/BR/75/M2904]